MKLKLLVVLLLIVLFSILSASSGFEAQFKENRTDEFEISFNLDEYLLKEVELGNQTYTSIISDCQVTTMEKGFAELPFIHSTVMLSGDKNYDLNIVSTNFTDYELNAPLVPSRGVIYRIEDPTVIPYEISEKSLQDQWYPQKITKQSDPFILREVRGTNLYAYPFQYNAVNQTLRVYNSIVVRLKENDQKPINPIGNKKLTLDMISTYENVFLNFNERTFTHQIGEMGEILVLYTSSNGGITPIQPYIDWKEEKGFTVHSQSVAYGSNVKNTIRDAYIANDNILYVQLIGDWEHIKSDIGPDSAPTDPMLGCVAGGDYYPDIIIGRFSASNSNDVTTQVNKAINYEKNPDSGAAWYKNALGMARNEGAGSGDDSEGDDLHMERIRENRLLTYNYSTVHQEYDGSSSYVPSNTTASTISNRINSGVSVLNYINHGSETGWSVAGYDQSDVNGLSNGNKLPFIWSVACVVGKFHRAGGDCFAETWLKKSGGGAVATLMSTINQPWQPPMRGQDYFNDLLIGGYNYSSNPGSGTSTDSSDKRTTFGSLSFNGMVLMYSESSGSSDLETIQTWTIFGDASLQVRTDTPTPISLSNSSCMVGTPFSTTVNSASGFVENALVSLTQNGINYTGFTDINGYVSIDQSLDVGQATLVVSGYNLDTEYSIIDVVTNNGPYLSIQNVQVSAGDDNVIEFGETTYLTVTLENAGSDPATNVSMNLSENSPYLSLSDSGESFGTIAVGATATRTNAYTFNASSNIPDNYAIQLDAAISSSEDNWNDVINLTAYAADLDIQNTTINDGGNGILDPGESATIQCSVINNGGADVTNLGSVLSSSDSYITISDNHDSLTGLSSGESRNITFNISADAAAPIGHLANFLTTFSGDNGFSQTDNFSITIGLTVEDFETGDFSNYPWAFGGEANWIIENSLPYEGNYCVKSGDTTHNQSSELTLQAQVISADEITFYRKVSSESSYDYLRFYIDGVQQEQWAGTLSWSQVSYPVSAGYHEFKWSYEKDGSVDGGSDCAWIDYIELPPLGETQPDISINPLSLSFGDVILGNNSTQLFSITNNGSAVLSGNITTPSGFSIIERSERGLVRRDRNTISYSVLVSGSKTFDVTFAPTVATSYSSSISISSNDPDTPSSSVTVSGSGVNPASVSFNPTSINKTLGTNETSDELLTISNSGGVNLNYTACLEYVTRTRDEIINESFSSFPPTGWSISGGSNWQGGTSNNAGGTSPEARFYWSPSTDAVQRLISPAIDSQNFSNVVLQFKHNIDDYNGSYTISVQTSSDGSNWTNLTTFPSVATPATIENISIDNTDVGSATFQLAFVFSGNSYNINNWYIDDVILSADSGPSYNWLTFNGSDTTSGTVLPSGNNDLTISLDSNGLSTGTYQANLLFTTNDPNNANVDIPVTLIVDSGGSVDPVISVSTNSLSQTLDIGQTSDQNFTITNIGDQGAILSYTIEADETTRMGLGSKEKLTKVEWFRLYENTRAVSWLDITPTSGNCTYNEDDQIEVTFDASGLASGLHEATITIASNGGSDQIINVSLDVTDASGDYPNSPKSIAEFSPMQGVLVSYPFGIPVSLIAHISQHANVTTIVANSTEQNTVTSTYNSNGVNVSNCDFLIAQSDSYWTRDYGPLFIRESNQKISLVDFTYNRPRPNDNAVPQHVSDFLGIDSYLMPIEHTGGNYMTDGLEISASTTIVYTENSGLTSTEVDLHMQSYCGVDEYHVVEDPNNTYIDHIDCWGKFLDVDKILIRKVPSSHAQYTEIENTAAYFASQTSSYGTPYQIFRVYTPNNEPYSNSIIVNDYVYVPQMGSANDSAAISVYQNAMPGYSIVGFEDNGSSPWESTDAIHCRIKGIADNDMLYVEHIPLSSEQSDQNNYTISSTIVSYGQHNFSEGFPRVYYRIDSGSWQYLTLSNSSGDTFEATIPAQAGGSTVEYYLSAQDVSGRTTYQPFTGGQDPNQFTVTGSNPPLLDVSVSSISKYMEAESVGSENLLLTNQGGGSISYSLSLSPERETHSRDISGSTITCSHSDYTAGETVAWTFTVTNASTDAEWLKDVYIDFPAGVTINSATNFIGGSGDLIYDGNTGNGLQINWHGEDSSGWGVIHGGETASASVNVTINNGFTGDLIMNYQIDGDIYGSEPHVVYGDITLNQLSNPLSWISLQTESGTLNENETDLIVIDFDSSGLTTGQYSCDLTITDNRDITIIPITLDVVSQPNYPEWNETNYPNPVAEIHGYATIDGYDFEPGDIVGAFCNDECRGTATIQNVDRAIYFYLRSEVSSSNETLDFKVYDVSDDETFDSDYSATVNSGDVIGSAEDPVQVEVVTSIDSPTNISVNYTGNQLTINWDPVPDAIDYNVFSCDTPDGTFIEETGGTINRSSWTINISPDVFMKYYYVKAVK